MPDQVQSLRDQLAAGKIRPVINQIISIAASDPDLHQEALHISGQFADLERHTRLRTLDHATLQTARNQISDALFSLIDQLPVSGTPLRKKWSLEKIALWLGLFAAIAAIAGYSLKDVFKKPEPVPIEKPAQPDTKITEPAPQPERKQAQPSVVQKPDVAASSSAKNNPNIIVKDKAKVGIINTGDTARFENIKQDF